MRVLADTNVLARIAQPGHHQHRSAQESVRLLLAQEHDLCILPQVLYEFWVVATKPAAANGLELSIAQAEANVAKARRIFALLRDERAIFTRWDLLVRKHQVKGKNAHDARLVAGMDRHGLTHLLTFNAHDFRRYPGITVLTPDGVLESG